MRTPTTSTSVLGLPSPQQQPYQEFSHMPSAYLHPQIQQQQLQHQPFDTKNNPMMEFNANNNTHTRKHSLNQGRYHKKIHGKDYGRKRNEYDEKFVSEMSVNEKEINDTEYTNALASSLDDASQEMTYDDSAQFETNLSCELTEFEKQILSKYLSEYSDDGKGDDSTDDLDLITKCDEEIAHDDQPVILPTTIAALEGAQVGNEQKNSSLMSDECASSSFNSDELVMQEEFVVKNEDIQQFAKEYQIGTSCLSTLKTSDNNNEFNNNIINNNDNDFGLSASIESSVITTISSTHPHQEHQSFDHHIHSKKENQQDINNNSFEDDDKVKQKNNKNISRTNSTGSSSNISSNRLRVILRNNYPIWIGITSCVWGLIIYLMKSYT